MSARGTPHVKHRGRLLGSKDLISVQLYIFSANKGVQAKLFVKVTDDTFLFSFFLSFTVRSDFLGFLFCLGGYFAVFSVGFALVWLPSPVSTGFLVSPITHESVWDNEASKRDTGRQERDCMIATVNVPTTVADPNVPGRLLRTISVTSVPNIYLQQHRPVPRTSCVIYTSNSVLKSQMDASSFTNVVHSMQRVPNTSISACGP